MPLQAYSERAKTKMIMKNEKEVIDFLTELVDESDLDMHINYFQEKANDLLKSITSNTECKKVCGFNGKCSSKTIDNICTNNLYKCSYLKQTE